MLYSDAQIEKLAKELGVASTNLIRLPSLGSGLNYINNNFQDNLKDLIESKGHEVISIKTSDVRFTCTYNDDNDEPSEIANSFEYSNIISDYRGEPVRAKADFIWAFRFNTMNFFKQDSLEDLHNEMKAALKKKLTSRLHHLPQKERKEIIDKITARVKNGTAFQVASIVTMDKTTGTMLHWARKQAGGSFLMALFAYKRMPFRKYTVASDKNQSEWEPLTKTLNVDDCVSISTPREGLTCARLALKKY